MSVVEDSVLEASDGGEDESTSFSFARLYASMSPAQQANHDRWWRAQDIQNWMFRHLPWMRLPALNFVYSFWALIFDEGIRSTLHPNWGGLAFHYLNDGMKPTLWHTWQQVMHPGSKWDGIYMHGAPRNLREAEDIEDGFDPRYPNFNKGRDGA